AILEVLSTILVSCLIILWFRGQQQERERRLEVLSRLELARQELASQVDVIKRSERRLAGIAIENARLYQQALSSQERYRDLFDNATVAILVQDLEGRVTAANKSCANLTGYPLEELAGLSIRKLIPFHAYSGLAQVQQALLRGETRVPPYDIQMVRRDGAECILSMTTR
ncbi:MAG: PAS domain S-box protein, partial [Chloroflexota bacterium]